MITITKEFTFDCAHMLTGHEGACKNLHGHTYKLHVTLSRPCLISTGTEEGMLIDFSHLKDIVKELIIDKYDHAYIFNTNGGIDELKIAHICEEARMRTVSLTTRATAEHMASLFFNILKNPIAELGCRIESIKLWETPTSYAEVTRI